MSKTPKPGKMEFTVQGACFECMHMGWCTFNDGTEVQRCDTCAVFQDDDAAMAYALRLAAKALANPRNRPSGSRTGKRFKEVLAALEIAAERLCPTPWIADPSPDWLRAQVGHLGRLVRGATTTLQIAYEMQGAGLFYSPTGGENVGEDYEYVRENLDRDRLETLLRNAGCECGPDGLGWRVSKNSAA